MKQLILLLVLIIQAVYAQMPDVTEFVKKEAREAFAQKLRDTTISMNFSVALSSKSEKVWQEALWAAELIYDARPATLDKINEALQKAPGLSESFARSALEAAYTLSQHRFTPEIRAIFDTVTNPKLFAMCAVYLTRSYELNPAATLMRIAEQYTDTTSNPIITCLIEEAAALMDKNPHGKPELRELLTYDIGKGITIYSLQRKNRNYPGMCIIKGADGRFLRNDNGRLFCVPQLARSLSNLPGYLTNGSTPEGVFAFTGFDTSSNIFIGPTANLQMVLPFETSVQQYLHTAGYQGGMNISVYEGLLPPSWRGYHPIYTAYYAGLAGRSEIIAHGTTVDPSYYTGQPFGPWTPTMGCLCTFESWDGNTGALVASDQLKLAEAVQKTGYQYGYVVVVNVDDRELPVSPEEAAELVTAANR